MSLYDNLVYSIQLDKKKNTRVTTYNIEIETKFYNTKGIDKLINHLKAKGDIFNTTTCLTVDYLNIKKSNKKYSFRGEDLFEVTKCRYVDYQYKSTTYKTDISNEKETQINDEDLINSVKEKASNGKLIKRTKDRTSYFINTNLRLDKTIINDSTTEVELEVIDNKSLDVKDYIDKIKFIDDLLLFYSYDDNTKYINSTINHIYEFYNKSLSTDVIIDKYNSHGANVSKESLIIDDKINWLLHSKPRDLQLKDLTYNGINSVKNLYSASLKASGSFKIMVITNVGVWLVTIKGIDTIFIPYQFSIDEDLRNSIYVGEYMKSSDLKTSFLYKNTYVSSEVDVNVDQEKLKYETKKEVSKPKIENKFNDIETSVKNIFLVYDALVFNEAVLSDFPYNIRYKFVTDNTIHKKLFDDILCYKKNVFFMSPNMSFFDVCNKALEDRAFYKDDGIVLTPINGSYIAEGQMVNWKRVKKGRYLENYMDVCKWKPLKELTLDFEFMYEKNNENFNVYINGKKSTIYENTDSKFKVKVKDVIKHTNLVFNINKKLTARLKNNVVSLEPKIKYIIEFQYDNDEFNSIIIRDEKEYRNAEHQIKSVWSLIKNPIDIKTLQGKDIKLFRKFMNNNKRNLLSSITGYVLDIGFGKGGDIDKYEKATKIIGIEPKTEHIKEAYDRLTKYPGGKKFSVIKDDFMTMDLSKIYKELPTTMRDTNFTFSFMFSITFFYKDIISFAKRINDICEELKSRKCRGIHLKLITLDGLKLLKNLKVKTELDYNDIHIKYIDNNKLKIIIDNSATVYDEQEEYLVFINELFNLTNFSLDTMNINSNKVLLNINEQKYVSLITKCDSSLTKNNNTNIIKPIENLHVYNKAVKVDGKLIAGSLNDGFLDDTAKRLDYLSDSLSVDRIATINKKSLYHAILKCLDQEYRNNNAVYRVKRVNSFVKELNYNTSLNFISNYSNIKINVIEGNILRSYGNFKQTIYINKCLDNNYESLRINNKYIHYDQLDLNIIELYPSIGEYSSLSKINFDKVKLNNKLKSKPKPKSVNINSRISLTFGDSGENNIGTLGSVGSGIKIKNIKSLREYFQKLGKVVETYNLGKKTDEYSTKYKNVPSYFVKDGVITWTAKVLVIRNYLDSKNANMLYQTLYKADWDKQYFDIKRGKVLNKNARHNLVIVDGVEQEPDYENKKDRILDTFKIMTDDDVPIFANIKAQLNKDINEGTNTNKGDDLICEANHYFDINKCGIGYHGDTERRKVFCLSLGKTSTVVWQWYKNGKAIENETTEIKINHGDLYIMSEKAVGYDWKTKKFHTIRHAAGCSKYIN